MRREKLSGIARAFFSSQMVVFCCGIVLLGGCSPSPRPSAANPRILRVGVLPDQTRERLETIYKPFLAYLELSLGIKTQLVVPDSYQDLTRRFVNGELDLAYFGAVTYVEGESKAQAEPLVMRVIDQHFTSVVIARTNLSGSFPNDFRGRSLLFGSPASTSGHRMPRHFFQQSGLVPEDYFGSVGHKSNHDEVLSAVAAGEAELGVLNREVFRKNIANGSIDPALLRVVWESPPYSNYVWATSPRLPRATREQLLDAFLHLDITNPDHVGVMTLLGAKAYVPAARSDFGFVRKLVLGVEHYAKR